MSIFFVSKYFLSFTLLTTQAFPSSPYIFRIRYYGGGTLQAAAADSLFRRPRHAHPHEWMEDGTPNFFAIAGESSWLLFLFEKFY